MFIIDIVLKYNLIFKYYLCIILFFNFYIFYNIFYNNEIDSNFEFVEKKDNNFNYLKKLLKILNNPIIAEYQLEQIKKINEDSNKYLKCKKTFLTKLKKSNSVLKCVKKKIVEYGIEDKKINNTIIKLMCVNF